MDAKSERLRHRSVVGRLKTGHAKAAGTLKNIAATLSNCSGFNAGR